jgi:salicylate hydroxylase
VHRHDLLSILVGACRAEPLITLETDRCVVDVRSGPEAASVRCADGTVYSTDLLVGADGLHSRVRTLISADEPVSSGFVAYRGTLPMDEVRADVAADDVVLWVGPGLHLIQYPVRRGEVYNQVAVFRSERLIRGETPFGTVAELEARFSRTCPQVREHVARISRDRNWPLYDRDPLTTWIHGRTALLGDAAHPMLQYLGQGACQALEDALVLAQEVERYGTEVDKALGLAHRGPRDPRAAVAGPAGAPPRRLLRARLALRRREPRVVTPALVTPASSHSARSPGTETPACD